MRVFLGDMTHTSVRSNDVYVPLNIGYCASYAKSKFGDDIKLGLFKDPALLLQKVEEFKPRVIGLSLYYWSAELTKVVTERIKILSPESFIALGGPCIDTEKAVQDDIFARYPHADALVPNEGEYGFAGIIERCLGGGDGSIPGVTLRGGNPGLAVGLTTDLAKVPSPYLAGYLTPFLGGEFRPIVQTSRLCPYTCSFCVSGKDRGKLRSFPLDVIKAELEFIGQHFKGDKDTLFYLTDENFGILERDLEVADLILQAKAKFSYPRRIFYYNDKRFTQLSRDLQEKVGDMCWHGVCLSLQSENPEALKAIKRRNLTDEQIVSALAWAKNLKLKTSTELIFGLPGETKETFLALLDKCYRFGFETINVYNLILFDGIEMNRRSYRAEHKLITSTKVRRMTKVGNSTVIERDDTVIQADTFSVEDFILISRLSALMQLVFLQGFHTEFFTDWIATAGSMTACLLAFLTPLEGDSEAAVSHRSGLYRMDEAVFSEYDEAERFIGPKPTPFVSGSPKMMLEILKLIKERQEKK